MKSTIEISLGLVFTLLMITFSQTSFAAGCDTLKSGQAAFFEHGNYKGACVVRSIGRYASAKDVGIGNDKISSIKLGPSTQLKLCKDSNFRGGCRTYTKSTAGLGSWNDETSSAIVEKFIPKKDACSPNDNQVAVYEDIHYKGACAVLGIGDYLDSSDIGVANDTISSVRVGKNVVLVGFEHRAFSSVTFYAEEDHYRMRSDNRIPGKNSGQGDKISSIKVLSRNKR